MSALPFLAVRPRARRIRGALVLSAIALAASCNDATAPSRPFHVVDLGDLAATALLGAPGEPLARPVTVRVVDDLGRPVTNAVIEWRAANLGARVKGADSTPDADGHAAAVWVLGTIAAETQQLVIAVSAHGRTRTLRLSARAVPHVVAGVRVGADSLRLRLGVADTLLALAIDPYGNEFVAPGVRFASLDPSVAAVDSLGVVRPAVRGATGVVASLNDVADTVPVAVVQVVDSIAVAEDTIRVASLGAPRPLELRLVDDIGLVVEDSLPSGIVGDTTVARIVTESGLAVVGVREGSTPLILSAGGAERMVSVIVRQVPASIAFEASAVTLTAIGAAVRPTAVVRDSAGSPISSARPSFASLDTLVVGITPAGEVVARANGSARVVAQVGTLADTLSVRVAQRVARVRILPDTIRFDALGDTSSFEATPFDSLGTPVPASLAGGAVAASSDALVFAVDETGPRATGPGAAELRVTIAGVVGSSAVVVRQRATRLELSLVDTLAILNPVEGGMTAIACRAFDRNGFAIGAPDVRVESVQGTLSAGGCASLRAVRSGLDTLLARVDGVTAVLPVAVALRAVASHAVGVPIALDSFPTGAFPWAPTAHVNDAGEIELYAAGYAWDTTYDANRGSLHRLVSEDGTTFRYDGVAIPRDTAWCAERGSGVENVAVLPRTDGAGWRMLYAAGDDPCYGWQVYSAVSTDGRSWTLEPGVRMDNGLTAPGAGMYQPAGEGFAVDRLPDGTWRALVGGYDRSAAATGGWRVVEWRSGDQLSWSFVGVAIAPADVGMTRAAYSPTIRQFAPGLHRMLFTADDLDRAGGRSRVYSAVSVDRIRWQIEGELMGQAGTDLFYATLAGERLYVVRRDAGGANLLASVTVRMP